MSHGGEIILRRGEDEAAAAALRCVGFSTGINGALSHGGEIKRKAAKL